MSTGNPFDTYLVDDPVSGPTHTHTHTHSLASHHRQSSSSSNRPASRGASFANAFSVAPHALSDYSSSPTSSASSSSTGPTSSSSSSLQLQFPSFLLSGHPPVLAHGGGAEVINPGIFSPGVLGQNPLAGIGPFGSAMGVGMATGPGVGVGSAPPGLGMRPTARAGVGMNADIDMNMNMNGNPGLQPFHANAANVFGDMTSAWFVPHNLVTGMPYRDQADKFKLKQHERERELVQQPNQKKQQHVKRKYSQSEGGRDAALTYAHKRSTNLPFHFEDDTPPPSSLAGASTLNPDPDNSNNTRRLLSPSSNAEKSRALDAELSSQALTIHHVSTTPSSHYISPMSQPHPHVYSGLPVYSQSGFDMLSILGRVATRPNPRINLGPVDMSCSFVVVDVRRYDCPIVYASPTFTLLTGYSEREVLGRNCRFLQAPPGSAPVESGSVREHTSGEAVSEMKRNVMMNKEFQVSLVNYRKDGRPFVNRVSIVPVPYPSEGLGMDAGMGEDDIAFHVGFQVDLNEQPGHILQRLKDGQYHFTSFMSLTGNALTPGERSARAMSVQLRRLLADRTVQGTLSSPGSVAGGSSNTNNTTHPDTHATLDAHDDLHYLNLLLLEHSPDFIHVLSLKGHFLYVSPSIKGCLGYESGEMVGKLVTEFVHPADCVPVLRELKAATGGGNGGGGQKGEDGGGKDVPAENNSTSPTQDEPTSTQPQAQSQPDSRTVDLLFRIRNKSGAYTWLESVGRLHVEAGKSRKAVVFVGRVRCVPCVRWGTVAAARELGNQPAAVGGSDEAQTQLPIPADPSSSTAATTPTKNHEFWGMLSTAGTFLVASASVKDVLQFGAAEVIGRSLRDFIARKGSRYNEGDVREGETSGSAVGTGENDDGYRGDMERFRRALESVVRRGGDYQLMPSFASSTPAHSMGAPGRTSSEINNNAGTDTDAWASASSTSTMKTTSQSTAAAALPTGKASRVHLRMQRKDGSVVPMVATFFGSDDDDNSGYSNVPSLGDGREGAESVRERESGSSSSSGLTSSTGGGGAAGGGGGDRFSSGSGPPSRPSSGSGSSWARSLRCPSVVVKFECSPTLLASAMSSAVVGSSAQQERPSTSDSGLGSSSYAHAASSPAFFPVISSSSSSWASPHSYPFSRPSHANVFEELEPHRETSWQYELQQLKFANNKLMEEIASIDENLEALRQEEQQQAVSSAATSTATTSAGDGFVDANGNSVAEPKTPTSTLSSRQQQQQRRASDKLRLSPMQPFDSGPGGKQPSSVASQSATTSSSSSRPSTATSSTPLPVSVPVSVSIPPPLTQAALPHSLRLPNPLDPHADWEVAGVAGSYESSSLDGALQAITRHDAASSSQSILGKRTWDGRNV